MTEPETRQTADARGVPDARRWRHDSWACASLPGRDRTPGRRPALHLPPRTRQPASGEPERRLSAACCRRAGPGRAHPRARVAHGASSAGPHGILRRLATCLGASPGHPAAVPWVFRRAFPTSQCAGTLPSSDADLCRGRYRDATAAIRRVRRRFSANRVRACLAQRSAARSTPGVP